MLDRLRATDDTTRWTAAGLLLLAVVGIPMVVSGPGNDLDVANVFRSGRAIARHLDYVPSRAPGTPVHEAVVGVLDLLGGPLLTNLASLVAAAAVVVGLDVLLRGEGLGPGRRWAVALVAANPWFLVAATSTADYLFALAFAVWAAVALRDGRPVPAGVLFALALGSRVGTVTLLAAAFAAELWEADRPAARRRVVTAGLVTAALTVVLFVPSVVEAGGLAFARNDFAAGSALVLLGRAAAKDVTLLGPIASVVALAAVPAVWAALRRFGSSWVVRFGLLGAVASQVLFVRFPWKMPHLLPTLVCGALLLAVALADRSRLLALLVALQLVYAVVQVDLFAPDDPGAASGATIELDVGWGPVVRDWRCRREHRDAYLQRQKPEVEAAWDCARPFGPDG